MTIFKAIILAAICSLGLAELLTLDDNNKNSLNGYVMKELGLKIPPVIDETNIIINEMAAQCKQEINIVEKQCNNTRDPSIYLDWLEALRKKVLDPKKIIMEILERLVEEVISIISPFLGGSTQQFLEELQRTIKNVGDIATDLTEGTAKELQNLVKSLTDLANHLGSELENNSKNLLKGISDLGSNVGDALSDGVETISDALEDVAGGIQDNLEGLQENVGNIVENVGNIVENVGDTLSDATNRIFGGWGKRRRRRRRRSVCPICNTTESLSLREVEKRVCGSEYQQKLQLVEDKLKILNQTISSIKNLAVILKVEYDLASFEQTLGVAFSTVFITYNLGSEVRYPSHTPLIFTDLSATAVNVTDEIFYREIPSKI